MRIFITQNKRVCKFCLSGLHGLWRAAVLPLLHVVWDTVLREHRGDSTEDHVVWELFLGTLFAAWIGNDKKLLSATQKHTKLVNHILYFCHGILIRAAF